MAKVEICPEDSGITNTMLKETRYFQILTKKMETSRPLLEAMFMLWTLEVPHWFSSKGT
jgi:hypothetical protein